VTATITETFAPAIGPATNSPAAVREALSRLHEACHVVAVSDHVHITSSVPARGRLLAVLPPCVPQGLGSAAFRNAHRVKLAYLAGGMALGIASTDLVTVMARAGLLAAFGAGGLPLPDVERAAAQLSAATAGASYVMNLLHAPHDPALEQKTVEIYLQHGVRAVEASAFMDLTAALVRYRVSGLRRRGQAIAISHKVIAKVSRLEVGTKFLSPPPSDVVSALVNAGELSAEQADLSRHVPMADDITVEADSGGHTDGRPLPALLPQFLEERYRLSRGFRAAGAVRIGAAGGIGTPYAAAAAIALGADYLVTGSINQVSVEAAVADDAKVLLCAATPTDFAMAPAADMFEAGAQVQVLKRGTLFAQKAKRLRELFLRYNALDELTAAERGWLEKQVFKRPIGVAWEDVVEHLGRSRPAALARAEADERAKMALLFRWYLGVSSRWAQDGVADRVADYQLWAGPALGAFNAWVAAAGLTHLQRPSAVDIAAAIMWGAAYLTRVNQLRLLGFTVPAEAAVARPAPDALAHISAQSW